MEDFICYIGDTCSFEIIISDVKCLSIAFDNSLLLQNQPSNASRVVVM